MDAVAGSLLSGRTRLLAGASIAPCSSSLPSSQSSATVRSVLAPSSAAAAANASNGAVSSSNAAVRRRRRFSSCGSAPLSKSLLCPFSMQELQLKPQRRFRGGLWSVAATADGAVVLEVSAGEEKTEEAAVEAVPIEKRYPAFPAVLDINSIRDILPHRFPFLLVDRVIEYNPGVSAVGIKNVTINDNFFPGHFPERPIMPGVLMVEAMAQVGGIMMLSPDMGGSKENFFFAGVDKVRFRKPVIAGDTLVMRMNLVKLQKRFGIAKLEGKAYVGGEVVCEGEFLLAMGSDV